MVSLQEMRKKLSYEIRVAIVKLLSLFNMRVVRNSNYLEISGLRDKYYSVTRWIIGNEISDLTLLRFIVYNITKYPQYSQLQQDLIALYIAELTKSQDRFFVEFGASDGITYSNSYLLEKSFGWSGILSEPGKNWHGYLAKNRTAKISRECVWSATGEIINFAESKNGEYSTIHDFIAKDSHYLERRDSEIYGVQTISLNDLLLRHDAPNHINYMSIDTEGSEYEILKNFDISNYKIDFITIEHNFTENRELIHEFMIQNGYIRILEKMSEWDDWYVTRNIFNLMVLHDQNYL